MAARIKGRAGPLPLEQAPNLGSQLSDALATAHDKGVIHRDLKPDNVMIIADAKAPGGEHSKLRDFGIAKLADDSVSLSSPGHVTTSTNSIMGTDSAVPTTALHRRLCRRPGLAGCARRGGDGADG